MSRTALRESPAGAPAREHGSEDAARATGERALVAAASKVPTVTRESALVALDPRDDFAADRWAMFARWGTFARMSPPAERGEREAAAFAAFAEHTEGADRSPEAGADGAGGALDPAIIGRVIATDVIGRAKRCYEAALRKNVDLAGSLTVVFEISRGEVQAARLADSTFATASSFESCVVEAAYNANMPRVAAGRSDESIWVVRYPLRFRHDTRDVVPVVPGDADSAEPIDFDFDGDDPLSGLHD